MFVTKEKYDKLKQEYNVLKETSFEIKQDRDDIETANEQLQEALKREGEEDKSKILALEIALNERTEAYRVSDNRRLVLEEQMSTLF